MIEEIKILVADDYLDDALKLLSEMKEISQFSNDIILLSGRHKDLQRHIQLGKISFEQAVIEKNNIRFAILGLLHELSDTTTKKKINKIELLLKRFSLLNGILLRLIHTSIQIHTKAKILDYGSKPLQYMPKADIKACQGLENDYFRVTYDLLFDEIRVRYYEECVSILGKISLEDEVLFEYYHYMSRIIRFYSEALNEAIPWYHIAIYCTDPKEDNNLLLTSKKMLQSLRLIYKEHGKNIETEWHWISSGAAKYHFITDPKTIKSLEEEIENLVKSPNKVQNDNTS